MTMDKVIIGRTATAEFVDEKIKEVPVKIDTGADSSSVWASDIFVDDDHRLHFVLFDKRSPHYTGKKHTTKHYKVRVVRSSNGHEQVRYAVTLCIKLGGRTIRALFTLADRSKNTYPVLIGCRLLNKKFVVDVSLGIPRRDRPSRSGKLTAELRKDPKLFYEKYHNQEKEN